MARIVTSISRKGGALPAHGPPADDAATADTDEALTAKFRMAIA
jgi:hypothetical protein